MNVACKSVLAFLFYTMHVCAESVDRYCSYDEVAAALSNKQWDRSKFNQQGTIASTNGALEAVKVALYAFVGQSVKAQSTEYLDEIDISVNKLKFFLSDSKSKKPAFAEDHFEKTIELYLMALGDFARTHSAVIRWQVLRDAIMKSRSLQVTKTKCSHFEQMLSFRFDRGTGVKFSNTYLAVQIIVGLLASGFIIKGYSFIKDTAP